MEVVPPWIERPDLLIGIYCGSDHLLDAYLRGYAHGRPKGKKRPW